ncbi:MAG: nicotinate (nicotinamide) nucleotide adenylyltransferase [Mariprofundaceae bacterium]|nr:nicotinate (nicotinamide) nucleotide adenylyltransferase [Mariprofundaceae bacterium]
MVKTPHIAIFGGSFDPPHLGHQALVEAALAQLDVDALWIMPVGVPVHRQLSGKATAQQRLDWLKTMFAHDSRVHIKDWETKSSSPSPAIATLRRFQDEHADQTPTWLMGMDSYADLPNWVAYPEHQKRCNLLVFARQGCDKAELRAGWRLLEAGEGVIHMPSKAGNIAFLDIDLPLISSSQIRADVVQHQTQLPQSTCNAISVCYASALTDNTDEHIKQTNKERKA